MNILTEYLLRFSVTNPTPGELNLPSVKADTNFAKNVLAIIFGTIGALAVLTIIIGAMNLSKSGGNPEEISKAKRTIIYSVVGLLVALVAEALVFFVVGRL